MNNASWLDKAKETYLSEIRTVAPSYTPSFSKEPKIGPSMKQAGDVYEAERNKRLKDVELLRWAERAVRAIDATIERLELEAQESAAGVASKSTYTPPIPPLGEPPIPKLESPPQAGSGQNIVLNASGFVPSRILKLTDPKLRFKR